jgi:hypothetical protein
MPKRNTTRLLLLESEKASGSMEGLIFKLIPSKLSSLP